MRSDEIAALKNHDEFIKIYDGKRPYYGGSQSWFYNDDYKRVGCATVAAANIMAYLSKKEGYIELYKHRKNSKQDFIEHMVDLSKYVIPNLQFGIISALYFIEKVQLFAKEREVDIRAKWINNVASFEDVCLFIKDGLKKDLPIAMLMYKNKKLKEYDWHWMTVTKYYKNEDYTYVKVSTWGECKIIRLEEFYKYSPYSALVYFS